jgi:hypothetical protein
MSILLYIIIYIVKSFLVVSVNESFYIGHFQEKNIFSFIYLGKKTLYGGNLEILCDDLVVNISGLVGGGEFGAHGVTIQKLIIRNESER